MIEPKDENEMKCSLDDSEGALKPGEESQHRPVKWGHHLALGRAALGTEEPEEAQSHAQSAIAPVGALLTVSAAPGGDQERRKQ